MKIAALSIALSAAVIAQAADKAPIQSADLGSIDRHYIFSPQMGTDVAVDVWLPPEYNENTFYPVLYMHDGQNLFDASTTWNHQSWEVDGIAGTLIQEGIIEPVIVVGIHSEADSRLATLMPVRAVAHLKSFKGAAADMLGGFAPRGDEYVSFMVNTLKPLIDEKYRTRRDRANTYVGGSSMGGLMSIYALCERPDIFGGAMCLSTHWSGLPGCTDEFAAALRKYVEDRLPSVAEAFAEGCVPRLYFDHGTITIDEAYGPYQQLFNEMLRKKGYGPAYLMTYVAEGASHDEDAWSRRLNLPLTFLLHK